MTSYLPFSKQLKQDLAVRGWSANDLSIRLDVDLRTVRRWLAGTTSPKITLREELCRVLGKKGVEDLGLFSTRTDDLADEEASVLELSPDDEDASLHALKKITMVLQENAVVDHTQLFGVKELIQRVKEYLMASNTAWIISLHGEGGIGKTALAYEVAMRFAAQAGFTKVAWVSAKTSLLLPHGRIFTASSAELRWTNLVKKMADQLGLSLSENSSSWLHDFPQALRALARDERCLLIIDNLETVDDIGEVIDFLSGTASKIQIIKPHKVFLTTRYALLGKMAHLIEVSLTGLDTIPALQLIREEGDKDIKEARNEELQPIIDVTEGNPLLIKLIITRLRMSHLPLKIILKELQQVRQQLGKQMVDYLYVESLQSLEKFSGQDTARSLMGAFCPLSSDDTISYDELFKYSGIGDEPLFQQALTTACDLALIRASRLNNQYSIHSLLWRFVCGIDDLS